MDEDVCFIGFVWSSIVISVYKALFVEVKDNKARWMEEGRGF